MRREISDISVLHAYTLHAQACRRSWYSRRRKQGLHAGIQCFHRSFLPPLPPPTAMAVDPQPLPSWKRSDLVVVEGLKFRLDRLVVS